MKHRIFLKPLCLLLTLCFWGAISSRAEDYTRDGIVYAIDATNSTASVKGVTDKSSITTANIRARVLGCNVTSIGANAFEGCSLLTKVSIPTSVTSIESASFKDCSSLTSINIPTQVTNINSSTFEGCCALMNINTSSLINIRESAFKDCKSLITIDIPNVERIEDKAFEGCSSLETINNTSSVHYIQDSAFKNCYSLKTIHKPSLYRNAIGKSAFEGCSSLIEADFVRSCDIFILQPRVFKGCTSLTSIDLSNIEKIYSETFAGCTSLQTVHFGNGLYSMADDAFSGCTAIKSLDIPQSNSSFSSEGSVIFNKDKSSLIFAAGDIKSYVIPASVTKIYKYAFKDCIYLTNVSIPSSVTSIGAGAFAYNDALETILLKSKGVTFGFTSTLYGHENEMYIVLMNLNSVERLRMRELGVVWEEMRDKTKCAKG